MYESNCSNEWSPVILSYVSRHPFGWKKGNCIWSAKPISRNAASTTFCFNTSNMHTALYIYLYVLYKWDGKWNGPKRVREKASVVFSNRILHSSRKAEGIQSLFNIIASEWHPRFMRIHIYARKALSVVFRVPSCIPSIPAHPFASYHWTLSESPRIIYDEIFKIAHLNWWRKVKKKNLACTLFPHDFFRSVLTPRTMSNSWHLFYDGMCSPTSDKASNTQITGEVC